LFAFRGNSTKQNFPPSVLFFLVKTLTSFSLTVWRLHSLTGPKRSTQLTFPQLQCDQGPMLWFFKYFRQKIQRKNGRFWLKTKLNYICKILIMTLVFEKNANFFAENCKKSQKIVIITSTPGVQDCQTIFYFPLKIYYLDKFKNFLLILFPLKWCISTWTTMCFNNVLKICKLDR
jgi:hypothetical protein